MKIVTSSVQFQRRNQFTYENFRKLIEYYSTLPRLKINGFFLSLDFKTYLVESLYADENLLDDSKILVQTKSETEVEIFHNLRDFFYEVVSPLSPQFVQLSERE